MTSSRSFRDRGRQPVKHGPPDWLDELPQNLRNYRAVLWDATAEQLVVVPQGSFNDRIPTILLKPNLATSFGEALSIESLTTAAPAELRDAKRYVVLVGKIGQN